MALRIGDRAPDFDVTSSSGQRLKLSDFRGKKNVVLYFYPADFTNVCTRETCGFRDSHAELASYDTEVIGVSVDSDESHEKFASSHRVRFALVSDKGMQLSKEYSANSWLTRLVGKTARVTYVIDKQGLIAGVFDSLFRAEDHVDGAREIIKKLPAELLTNGVELTMLRAPCP